MFCVMQKSCILIICFCLLRFCASQQGPCVNYYNKPGVCVPIASCKPLLNLESNSQKTYDDVLILNGNYCGPESGPKWVCCESDGAVVSSSTSRPGFVGPFKIVTPLPAKKKRDVTSNILPDPMKSECGLHFPDRVFGGNATAIDEHPWTVLLQYTLRDGSRVFGCGGSLISQQYVLTAAHCIPPGVRTISLTSVRLGEWNTVTDQDCQLNLCSDAPIDVTIEEIITHPGYNTTTKVRYDDIALLRLSKKVNYTSFIRPICLPTAPELRHFNYEGSNLTVVGWGATPNSTVSDVKLKVELPYVPTNDCLKIFKKSRPRFKIRETQMCAGGELGKGSCFGDSGGPLLGTFSPQRGIHYNYLVGVISAGTKVCAKKNWPGIFTNVASYIDWIKDNVKD